MAASAAALCSGVIPASAAALSSCGAGIGVGLDCHIRVCELKSVKITCVRVKLGVRVRNLTRTRVLLGFG